MPTTTVVMNNAEMVAYAEYVTSKGKTKGAGDAPHTGDAPPHAKHEHKSKRAPRRHPDGTLRLSPMQQLHAEAQSVRVAILSMMDVIQFKDTSLRNTIEEDAQKFIDRHAKFEAEHPEFFDREEEALRKQVADATEELRLKVKARTHVESEPTPDAGSGNPVHVGGVKKAGRQGEMVQEGGCMLGASIAPAGCASDSDDD
ncbi:hypothetical protein T484DRAFT_1756899 [Baffinella frigidus]|nr:hypothetical protein T484DRAFT_1756899 [Cryptophyta sp. CCMP2293]